MYSERLERYRRYTFADSEIEKLSRDKELCNRIRQFLNHDDITEDSLVDAYYYNFSYLPDDLKLVFCRDMYLIYGITETGEIISKWIGRYDLDSEISIVDGKLKK